MLNWKPTVDLTKILPPTPPNAVASVPPAQLPIPSPIVAPATPQSTGSGLRGYRLDEPDPVERAIIIRTLPPKYSRLIVAFGFGRNLFLSPQAEKEFLKLNLPYTCLGTADDTGRFAEWSDLMTEPSSTFQVLE